MNITPFNIRMNLATSDICINITPSNIRMNVTLSNICMNITASNIRMNITASNICMDITTVVKDYKQQNNLTVPTKENNCCVRLLLFVILGKDLGNLHTFQGAARR